MSAGAVPRHTQRQAAAQASPSAPSSEDSFELAPPRRSERVNAELVQLVASFAPLELAQLKAAKQKARQQRAAANAVDMPAVDDLAAEASTDANMTDIVLGAAEGGLLPTAAALAAVAAAEGRPDTVLHREVSPREEQQHQQQQRHQQHVERGRAPQGPGLHRRTSSGGASAGQAAAGRSRSRTPTRPSYLPAAPAKGEAVRRDHNVSCTPPL